MTTLICIPTYDEAENIADIVRRTLAAVPAAHILIADDDSPDGTGMIADRLALADSRVHVLHRTAKQGLGAAYTAAFSWGQRNGFDVLVEMDADGSHRPEQLPRLLDALERGADVALGSRWVTGGAVEGWPLSRRFISKGGSAYARLALGIRQRDVTGGYRAYRAAALREIGPEGTQSAGYSFQIELLFNAVKAGLRIVEVPITFADRTLGTSKMSTRIVLEAMWRVTVWGVQALPSRWARYRAGVDARRTVVGGGAADSAAARIAVAQLEQAESSGRAAHV
ncbi:polyprenol monophosphomannose synthase [Schumannella soli]|uniref:Polyprenol monophosphomannose synthase n=1 Tax=Schumannella soli TaxID=2590779 RepID=A0A506YA27_9MICO|nr:polyprenol monophosphomannose synthase [Schumannella soli]TPW77957.1 polyprenol monophosphomannose synthase [Schumannella soli]